MKHPIRALPLLLVACITACNGGDPAPAQTGSEPAAPATAREPAAPAATEARRVATSFDLPADAIVSIRLQPTAAAPARVAFQEVVLVTGDVRRPVDLCADKRLQLVRSRKVEVAADGSCVIEFGNASGTGWIAPTDLRNLPASDEPRQLAVVANGAIEGPFKVYLDVGNGYGSRDMLQAESSAAPDGM